MVNKARIVCVVNGGVLQSVFVSPLLENVDLEVIDFDNDVGDDDTPTTEELENRYRKSTKGLKDILN
jgi:hypothetical protein